MTRQLLWIAVVETAGWLLAIAGWLTDRTGLLAFGLAIAVVAMLAFAPLIVLERLGRGGRKGGDR